MLVKQNQKSPYFIQVLPLLALSTLFDTCDVRNNIIYVALLKLSKALLLTSDTHYKRI